jgi:hypothetical protein
MTTIDAIRNSAQNSANDSGIYFAIVESVDGYQTMSYMDAADEEIIEVIKPEKRV